MSSWTPFSQVEGQQPGYSDNWSNQKLFRQFFQSAQIAVLTVARQQAHHELSFGITFSPQLSTSGSGWAIQTMLFRQSELFRQFIFGTFFCDPQITAFFRIKLFFDFFFFLAIATWLEGLFRQSGCWPSIDHLASYKAILHWNTSTIVRVII